MKSRILYLAKLLIQSVTDPFRHGLRRRAAQKEKLWDSGNEGSKLIDKGIPPKDNKAQTQIIQQF